LTAIKSLNDQLFFSRIRLTIADIEILD